MYSGLGKLEQGPSVICSSRTSSTMAEAGLKISAAALVFTVAAIAADTAAPGSAGWLWALSDSLKLPSLRSITAALHGLTLGLTVHCQSVAFPLRRLTL